MIYAFDVDGVLTVETHDAGAEGYARRTPVKRAVVLLEELRQAGHVVILWTGRRESRRRITEDWLDLSGVPYDFLFMGKPRFDVFCDDKAVSFDSLIGDREEIGDHGSMPTVREDDHLGGRSDRETDLA